MKIVKKIFFGAAFLYISAAAGSVHGQSTSFTANLGFGVQGNDVTALQQFLIAGGFLNIAAPTGYFGSLTRTALGAWQASVGIAPATGFFGPASRGKINAVLAQSGAVATTTPVIATTSTASGLPVRFMIPTLNISASFQYNGLKPDGTMEVPSNIYDVGWFTGSVRPGEKGVAIVIGHVAQIRGGVVTKPGVFSNLYELKMGDTLSVLNDEGKTTVFVVRAIRSYDPTADATDIFTSTDGGAHLNIITCEGTWVPSAASYTQRLVVFTDAVQ
jgi:hypothetical protein